MKSAYYLQIFSWEVGMASGRVFFGTRPAPPRPAPNGMGLKFIKRVWNGYEIFFNPGRVRVLPHPTPPRPAPFTYKINFKINLI